jgi:hypothetical protein
MVPAQGRGIPHIDTDDPTAGHAMRSTDGQQSTSAAYIQNSFIPSPRNFVEKTLAHR